jgi:hypothetical protein
VGAGISVMRICSSVTEGASLASFAKACRTLGSAVIGAADDRPARITLRVESIPTAERITHSRPQVTTSLKGNFMAVRELRQGEPIKGEEGRGRACQKPFDFIS